MNDAQVAALAAELTTDPLARGYAGMTAHQVADALNTKNRSRLRTHLSSAEIYENTDITEFQARSAAQQAYIRDIWGLGESVLVSSGSKARTVYEAIFGAGTQTRANLAAVLTESISRADELGLGVVLPGDVEMVRG